MLRHVAARIFLASLVLAAFAPSFATAQTPGGGTGTIQNPIRGNYTDIYLVSGRVVDALGDPVVGGNLTLTIDQKNTVLPKPLHAITDCYGVFITYFTIKHVEPAGKVTVTLAGVGAPDVTTSANFDPFYRRSDVLLQYQGKWNSICPDQTPYFPARISVQGRIVNFTDRYTVGDESYDALPYSGHVAIRWIDASGHVECPPPAKGDGCGTQPVDERGDFRYSFVFDANKPFNATGKIEILLADKTWNFTVDPLFRAAIARIDISGHGSPVYPSTSSNPTPGAPLALAIAVVGAAAIVLRRRME